MRLNLALLFLALFGSAAVSEARNPEISPDNALAGSWVSSQSAATVSFGPAGRLELDLNGDGAVDAVGRYDLTGNALSVVEDEGSGMCPRGQRGYYRFYLVEGRLLFKPVDDTCQERLLKFSEPWHLK